MDITSFARISVMFTIGLGCTSASKADEALDTELERVRQALAKYEDPYVAVRDLYLSTVGCVHYDGSKMEGHMDYPKGAMGIHFVNVTLQGPPDPLKPNVLIYEPQGNKLKLVAAEWLVSLASTKERPSLFGQAFQGPMEGHEPLIPQGFHHYDLHVWLFKDNPLGMFSPTNPDVSCNDAQFSLLEMPTKLVPEP
ncbi:hypothetical protein EET67_24965 [Pseudaminobacter arsenicus]|uniref:Uncharacterized protein n=1 Tax=Borborobacter arsenicus TaxID=1851146 RepID=A0A432UZ07_9HYPH|nr:hypothetical protein [Pseudaminobacter arsenicus]RUM95135.1 hypothetical protein EET67_24965 [Pseudaminobacter arsenicus]